MHGSALHIDGSERFRSRVSRYKRPIIFFDLIFRVLGEFVSEAEKVLSDELHVLLG